MHSDQRPIEGLSAEAMLQLLKTAINSSLDMIQVCKAVRNETGEIVDFTWILQNKTAEEIVGQVIGKSLLQRNPGVGEEGIFDTFKKVVETGVPHQSERYYRHGRLDGWFIQSIVKVDDGVATTTKDITERKKAEEKLREQGHFIRTITEIMPEMVSVVELPSRNIIYSNRDVFLHLGFDIAEISRMSFAERMALFYPEDVPAIQAFYERFASLKDEEENGLEYRVKNKWGQWVQLSLRGKVFKRDEEGRVTQALFTAQDVTEQRAAAAEVLQLKDQIAQSATDKYFTLFNSIGEGFAILELILDETGKPVDFIYGETNPAFIKHVGINLKGKRRSELELDKKDFLLEKYEQLLKTGETLHFEHYVEKLNKQWFQITAVRIGGEGSKHLGVIFRNITERKKLEQRQEYLIKLADALRSLSDPLQIQRAAMRVLGEQFGADRVLYSTITPDGKMWVTQDNYTSGRSPKLVGSFPTAAFGASVEPLSRGEVVVYPDVHKAAHLTKAEKQLYEEFDTRAALGVPLFKEARWIANIGIHHREPYEWMAEEIELVRETAERTWDAVERAKAEEALRKSEEKYRILFESIDDAYCTVEVIYNEDGKPVNLKYIETNPAFAKQTGLVNVVGKLASEVIPGTEPVWFEMWDKVLKTGETVSFENWHQDTGRWYRAFASPTGDSNNRQITIVSSDITERKLREEQQEYLMKLNDTLRSVVDAVEIEEKVTALAIAYFKADRSYYISIEGEEAIINRDAKSEGLPSIAGSYLLSSFTLFKKVIGEGVLFVVDDAHTTAILDEPLRETCIQLQVISFVNVPVIKNGEAVGILCIVQSTPRQWTTTEIDLAVETAERLWAAVERARTEEALRQSQKRFYSIANLVPDLLWESEPDGSTTWYNQRWLEYTGQSFEQAIGWGWVDTIHPDDREGSARRYAEAVKAAKPLIQQQRIRRHDGDYRWFVVSAFPIKDGNGVIVKMYGAATDIHESKTAQEALDKAHEAHRIQLEREVRDRTLELVASHDELEREQHFLKQVTDKAPLLIYVYDLGEERFTYINKRVEELIGKSEEYIYAMGPHLFQAILHPEDLPRYTAYMKGLKNLSGGQVTENDFRVWNGGQFRWFRSRDSVFREEKKHVLQVIGIAEDVTYEKMLEEKLQSKGPIGLN